MPKRTDKRTTVSLAHVVWDMAEEMMVERGFNDNFSAYIADLIRRDKERQQDIEVALSRKDHGKYEPHRQSYMLAEDRNMEQLGRKHERQALKKIRAAAAEKRTAGTAPAPVPASDATPPTQPGPDPTAPSAKPGPSHSHTGTRRARTKT